MPEQRRLLFLSPTLAMPGQHGGCVYPHALLTELHRRGIAVDYAWLGTPLNSGRRLMRDPLAADYVSRGWVRDTLKVGPFRVTSTWNGWLGRREPSKHGQTHGGEHPATSGERHFAANLLAGSGVQHVLVDGTLTLGALDSLSPQARSRLHVAVLTHNLISRRTELYRSAGEPLDFLPMTAPEEAALLTRADTIVAIQEREAAAFRKMVPGRRVVTVPMPVSAQPLAEPETGPARCLFVGGYSGHNLAALRALLTTIWPRVRAQLPDAELLIAGTVGRAAEPAPAGVMVLGPVADLRAAYARAHVCLVPLPMGTGLKIKLVEAMGHGRAVVTTPAGAEGFAELEAGLAAVVAEIPDAFADAVARLLSSPQERASVVARQTRWLSRELHPDHVVRLLGC